MIETSSQYDENRGEWVRRFSGPASPPQILPDPDNGASVVVRSFFPNPNDPIGIKDDLALGPGGYDLKTIDRARMGVIPAFDHPSWALNMIPFGVLLDGSIIDPSGPWYDGGPADPLNPFDRACSGWEYDVPHPTVGALVGVPDVIGGHVQPSGMFHYHGYPRLAIEAIRSAGSARAGGVDPVLVGYSADGFPILDHVFVDPRTGTRRYYFSGYVLREGERQSVPFTNPAMTPPGAYDGMYVQDFIYDPGKKSGMIEDRLARGESYHGLDGDALRDGRASYAILDAHNGAVVSGVEGYDGPVFAYFLTPDWPMIPRLFAFEPDDSFKNIIPFERKPPERLIGKIVTYFKGPGGRRSLYDACPPELASIRQWHGRAPY